MNLQVPMYHEGWDDIILFLPRPKLYPRRLDTILDEKPSILKVVEIMELVGLDPIVYDVDQENPHHNETILDHTCRTYDYIHRNYNGDYKKELLLASIFHDIGKLECKKWNEDKGYYTYYNHEKVSAQIALKKLSAILPNEVSTMVSTIVALHMRLSWGKDDISNVKLKRAVGEEMYGLLEVFREADKQR